MRSITESCIHDLSLDSPLASTSQSAPTVKAPSPPVSPTTAITRAEELDLSFLLSPRLYHPLPPPLFTPAPSESTVIDAPGLFSQGRYTAAAEASARRLAQPPPPPQQELLNLFYIRLAALIKLNYIFLAAAEAHVLEDVNSSNYRIEGTNECVLPWELRLLTIRMQSVGLRSARKGGVSALYELAGEARSKFRHAGSTDEASTWSRRLKELGWCTVEALVEEGDLQTAVRQMRSLKGQGQDEEWEARMVMLLLKIGDLDGARKILDRSDESRPILRDVLKICEGNYEESTESGSKVDGTTTSRSNKAMANFYSGNVEESSRILEALMQEGKIEKESVFNLVTCYELMAERAVRERKEGLVERVGRSAMGKEGSLSQTDFKI